MNARQLTITAAEWASVQDGTLWLVAKGNEHWLMAPDEPKLISATPPVEFVQACAPCETCGDQRIATSGGPGYFKGGRLHHLAGGQTVMEIRCPDCRIELVGPSDACLNPDPMHCAVTLGHAYPVGSPLPIYDLSDQGHIWPALVILGIHRIIYAESATSESWLADGDLLAHAGPVESLVGKWALQLAVVGS